MIEVTTAVLKQRRRYTFTLSHIVYSFVGWMLCCRTRGKTIAAHQAQTNLYQRGIKKIDEELDCVHLIHSIRQLKAILRTMYSANQQKLALCSSGALLKNEPLATQSEEPLQNFFNEIPSLRAKEAEIKSYEDKIADLMSEIRKEELKLNKDTFIKSTINS